MEPAEDLTLPKIARWLKAADRDHFDGAALFGISGEYVRRMCLPFSNNRRAVPTLRLRRVIAEKTGGEVGVDDWSPPNPEAYSLMQGRAA